MFEKGIPNINNLEICHQSQETLSPTADQDHKDLSHSQASLSPKVDQTMKICPRVRHRSQRADQTKQGDSWEASFIAKILEK